MIYPPQKDKKTNKHCMRLLLNNKTSIIITNMTMWYSDYTINTKQ